MRPVAIIQARMGSTRFPGKVMKPILGRPMLWHIVQRLRWTPSLADIVVATSDQPGDEPIRCFCDEQHFRVFAGSEDDVLDRFYQAATRHPGDPYLRITADCPFVDPEVVGRLIELYKTGRFDHVGVATGAGAVSLNRGRFPNGLDAECFSFAALERAWREATSPTDREHVTLYIWRQPDKFRHGMLMAENDYPHLRWTVDYEIDYQLVCQVYAALYREDKPFLMADILNYLASHPNLTRMNQEFIGKEGYQELWKAAGGPPCNERA